MFDEEKLKLLGRIAFGPDPEVMIRRIVTFKKGVKANNYIKGYNACDGKNQLKEIAKVIGVTPGTLSPILKQWEEIGIIYKKDNFYKKLFRI